MGTLFGAPPPTDHAMPSSVASVVSDSWTAARSAPLSMGFSRQEYWSRLPFFSPGDLPDPRIEPTSLMSPASAGWFCTTSAIGMPPPIDRWSLCSSLESGLAVG